MDLWLQQHPTRSNLIALAIGLLFFGVFSLVSIPRPALQLFACILAALLWFETIVLILPERWRRKVSELQFGPSWTAKRRARP
jgi:hypothetical protein